MAKDDVIEVDGKVLEIIPGGKIKVQLKMVTLWKPTFLVKYE